MKRGAWIAIGGSVLAGLALLCAASFFAFRWIGSQIEGGGRTHAFQEGFQRACAEQCAAAGKERGCDAYCRCRYEHMRGKRTDAAFARWAKSQIHDGGASQALAEAGDRADLECGGRLLEKSFNEQCAAACRDKDIAPSRCFRYCSCAFAALRRGKTKEEADRWWLANLAHSPFTPEGRRAFRAAVDECAHEALPPPPKAGKDAGKGVSTGSGR